MHVWMTLLILHCKMWNESSGGSLSHSFIVESRIKGPFSGSPAVVKYRVASKSTLQVSAAAHYTVCHRNEFLVCTFTILDNDAVGNLDMAGWTIFLLAGGILYTPSSA